MLQDCFTCPYKVVPLKKQLLNGQNQEIELFNETKILPNLEVFRDKGSSYSKFPSKTNLSIYQTKD